MSPRLDRAGSGRADRRGHHELPADLYIQQRAGQFERAGQRDHGVHQKQFSIGSTGYAMCLGFFDTGTDQLNLCNGEMEISPRSSARGISTNALGRLSGLYPLCGTETRKCLDSSEEEGA
jgi:hypothetical protein